MAFVTVIFAGLGVFSPAFRGSLLQVSLFEVYVHLKYAFPPYIPASFSSSVLAL